MDVALALFRYFAHGGMQRDAVAAARALARRDHSVRIYCHTLEGEAPSDVRFEVLPAGGRSNHARARSFAAALRARLADAPADVVVGFDKMPGLDLYFAADPCFVARTSSRPLPYRWTPRYRTFAALEAEVFAGDDTRVMLLDDRQRDDYQRIYGTPDARFVTLPPGIAQDRRRGPDAAAQRRRGREALDVPEDACVLLTLAANFELKGLDRAMIGLASLDTATRSTALLVAVGEGPARAWRRRAARLGLSGRCLLLAGRDDVPDLLQAADLLVHPARRDTTATVLLEAVAAGLPVLCTDACGYAPHVRAAGAGVVLPEPFGQPAFDEALGALITADRAPLRDAALRYAASVDLHGMHERIAEEVERRYASGAAT